MRPAWPVFSPESLPRHGDGALPLVMLIGLTRVSKAHHTGCKVVLHPIKGQTPSASISGVRFSSDPGGFFSPYPEVSQILKRLLLRPGKRTSIRPTKRSDNAKYQYFLLGSSFHRTRVSPARRACIYLMAEQRLRLDRYKHIRNLGDRWRRHT